MNEKGAELANRGRAQGAGTIAEYDHAATFNVDAAVARSELRADVLNSNGLKSVDIQVTGPDKKGFREIFRQISSKVVKTPEATAGAQRGYGAQDRLVPSDQLDGVQRVSRRRSASELAKGKPNRTQVGHEYEEVANLATDRIQSGGIESRPRTRDESLEIADRARKGKVAPEDVASNRPGSICRGAVESGKVGARVSVLFGLPLRLIRAFRSTRSGETSKTEAAVDVAKGAALDALDGFAKGSAAGAVTAKLAQKAISATKVNAAAAAAVLAVDVAKAGADLGRGKIDTGEFVDRCAESASASGGGLAGASIGMTVAGPPGALVGGLVGSIAGPALARKAGFVRDGAADPSANSHEPQTASKDARPGIDEGGQTESESGTKVRADDSTGKADELDADERLAMAS